MPNKNAVETIIAPPIEREFLGVQERNDLIRDEYSGALFKVDDKEVEEYLEKKRMREQQKETTERLNSLESDISDIKSMLTQLINK
jgi:uncharacterized protein YPO0396